MNDSPERWTRPHSRVDAAPLPHVWEQNCWWCTHVRVGEFPRARCVVYPNRVPREDCGRKWAEGCDRYEFEWRCHDVMATDQDADAFMAADDERAKEWTGIY